MGTPTIDSSAAQRSDSANDSLSNDEKLHSAIAGVALVGVFAAKRLCLSGTKMLQRNLHTALLQSYLDGSSPPLGQVLVMCSVAGLVGMSDDAQMTDFLGVILHDDGNVIEQLKRVLENHITVGFEVDVTIDDEVIAFDVNITRVFVNHLNQRTAASAQCETRNHQSMHAHAMACYGRPTQALSLGRLDEPAPASEYVRSDAHWHDDTDEISAITYGSNHARIELTAEFQRHFVVG